MIIKTYKILRYDTVNDDKIISQESTLKEDTTFYEVIVNKWREIISVNITTAYPINKEISPHSICTNRY